MGLKALSFDTLNELEGGQIALGIDIALKQAIADCHDRPGVKGPRKIMVELAVVPTPDDRGSSMVRAAVGFNIKTTNPPRGVVLPMSVGKNGELMFNSDAPDNPDQKTLYDDDQESSEG